MKNDKKFIKLGSKKNSKWLSEEHSNNHIACIALGIFFIIIQVISWYGNYSSGNLSFRLSFDNIYIFLFDLVLLLTSNWAFIFGIILLVSAFRKDNRIERSDLDYYDSTDYGNSPLVSVPTDNSSYYCNSSLEDNNSDIKYSNRKVITVLSVLLAFSLICNLLLLHKQTLDSENVDSSPVVSTAVTSTPSVSSTPDRYTFKDVKSMYKAVQRCPEKYKGSYVTVTGFGSYIGFDDDEPNSFLLYPNAVGDSSVDWLDLSIAEQEHHKYLAVYSYKTDKDTPRVLNKDKITITGKLDLVYSDGTNDYIMCMLEAEKIKFKKNS